MRGKKPEMEEELKKGVEEDVNDSNQSAALL